MLKIKGKEIPKPIGVYYILALCHMGLLLIIRLMGWNAVTNFLFFAGTFVSLGLAAYILHVYFRKETEDMDEEERKLKEDYGQIWFILAHLAVLLLFIFA